MSTTVLPLSACSRRISSWRLARFCGSRPVEGSSRKSTRGRWTSPIAMSSRRRWPPEREETLRSATAVRSRSSTSSAARRRASARDRPCARPWLISSSRPSWRCPAPLPCPTKPIARRTSRWALTTSWPATLAEPEVGAIRVVSMRRVVDFPAPLGPRKATSSPCPISRSRPCTASTVCLREVKWRVRPRVTIAGPSVVVVGHVPDAREPCGQFLSALPPNLGP